jgi:hypothetical protein
MEIETIPVSRTKDIEYTQSDEGCLVYDSLLDRVHFLNLTAWFVLRSCDGQTGRTAMAESLQGAFGLEAAPLEQVDACLSTLREAGLLSDPCSEDD